MILVVLNRYIDWYALHGIGCVVGVALCIYTTNLVWQDLESQQDCALIQWSRRVGHSLIALALLWSLYFADEMKWAPWPPDVALIWTVNIVLGLRIWAVYQRQKNGRTITANHA